MQGSIHTLKVGHLMTVKTRGKTHERDKSDQSVTLKHTARTALHKEILQVAIQWRHHLAPTSLTNEGLGQKQKQLQYLFTPEEVSYPPLCWLFGYSVIQCDNAHPNGEMTSVCTLYEYWLSKCVNIDSKGRTGCEKETPKRHTYAYVSLAQTNICTFSRTHISLTHTHTHTRYIQELSKDLRDALKHSRGLCFITYTITSCNPL